MSSSLVAPNSTDVELHQALETIDILRAENEKLRSDLADVQANLASAVEYNRTSTQLSDESQQVLTNLTSEFQEIAGQTSEQTAQVVQSRDLVDHAAEQLSEVKSASELIKNLANQTKLLALNAKIEAAQAGQAGAGFAIVADEVKTLSNETDKAVRLIGNAVQAIEQTSAEMSERIHHLETSSTTVQSKVEQFNTKIGAARDRNCETLTRIAACTDRVFMSLAKLDHIIWKVNTYRSLIERSPQFQFVDCHSCRLGKWYYEGEGHANFSTTSSYRQLEGPHETVHNATKRLFELLENSATERFRVSESKEILTEMERGSDGVFKALDQILMQSTASDHAGRQA